jgi:hypothetical protein
MAKLPFPPPGLASVAPELSVLPPGALLWRVYRAGGDHPASWDTFRTYGPVATGRFDHHAPPPREQPDRGILYTSESATAAIAEAFGDTRTVDRVVGDPWLVALEVGRDLQLLDLTGAWAAAAGAGQAIATGRRDIARAWSRAIHGAFPDVQGLRYRSAMAGGEVNVAIYERGAPAMPAHPSLHVPLSHPGLAADLGRLADTYGYDLR